MKKTVVALTLASMFLLTSCCTKNNLEAQKEETYNRTVEYNDVSESIQESPNGNPIDNAFVRFADENKDKLGNNVILAYLHALKWYDEFYGLRREFNDSLIDRSIYWMSDTSSAAYEYGNSKGDSHSLVTHFEGIARYYKMLTYDYLEQLKECGINAGIRSKEDTIYNYLNGINYDGNYDYNSFHTVSWVEKGNSPDPMPAIAGIDVEDIFFLYSEFGAVLSVKGEQRLFSWNYFTPRQIMPRLSVADFDGNGEDELAAILYNGSGTGVSIEELHIVDLNHLTDVAVTIDDIVPKLQNRFSASYDPDANEITLCFEEKVLYIDVAEINLEDEHDFGGIGFGSIISFNADGGKLSVNIGIGLYRTGQYVAFDIAEFYADLTYEDGNISLSKCRMEYRP